MKNQIIGYIVTTEYFGEPLELVDNGNYPWPVLLRGDFATVFKRRKAANAAIEKTIEWAGLQEEQEPELKPLGWADKYKYRIWRLRGAQE